ncbi:MAG TPA: type II secretion system F family protein [Frankiaceae bacterium]|jgi:type IV pilus assembly protein PilC|nr:type II secretion system F family protein [Frankiaceae bacterium]
MATTYAYAVRDRAGKMINGHLEADSPALVATKLKAMGYAPINITEANAGMKREITIPGMGKKVKLKELAIMSRQFATMVNSGLPLLRALRILAEQTESKELSRVLHEVRADVEGGSALSVAMAKFSPKVFPPLMINMARAGEVGGFLDTVLLQVAENYEAEVKLRGKVKSAMTYPVIVFIMAMLMCTAMLLFIVPVFAKMFSTLGGKLPAPTRLLMDASDILKSYFPIFFLMLVGFIIVWKKVKHDERVRNVVDPLKLKMPVFGNLAKKIALSRFARNLGTLMSSGVPILQSLEIVAGTTGNVVLSRAIADVQESVRSGESLTAPLSNHSVFPPMVVQMMAVGEDVGALDEMLAKISEFYDQEVEATTEALTALIEPLMIAFLGGVVGSMVIALYMPMFKIYNLVS